MVLQQMYAQFCLDLQIDVLHIKFTNYKVRLSYHSELCFYVYGNSCFKCTSETIISPICPELHNSFIIIILIFKIWKQYLAKS